MVWCASRCGAKTPRTHRGSAGRQPEPVLWRLGSVSRRWSRECVKRVLCAVLLSLSPASAFAQASDPGGADALVVEIDRDYAVAQGGDCATACKALDSMRRAADRLCQLDPGDRCAKARQKVSDATARVNASCPSCAQPTSNAVAGGAGQPPAAPPAPAEASGPSESKEAVAQESAPRKGGGCAGCTSAPGGDGLAVVLGVGGLVLLGARRRRR
jgi:MYXO-CTERM domain-containing protein